MHLVGATAQGPCPLRPTCVRACMPNRPYEVGGGVLSGVITLATFTISYMPSTLQW